MDIQFRRRVLAMAVATASALGTMSSYAAGPPGALASGIVACPYTPQELTAAIGIAVGAGRRLPSPSGSPQQSCTYDQGPVDGLQVRVNTTWLEPGSAVASRTMLLGMLAGQIQMFPGDPGGGRFQNQSELGTYALYYWRGNLLYEVRLLTFKGGAVAAKAKLLSLRRL